DKVDLSMTLRKHYWPLSSWRQSKIQDLDYLNFKTDLSIKSEEMNFAFDKEEIKYDEKGLSQGENFSGTILENASATNTFTQILGRQFITPTTFTNKSDRIKCIGETGIYEIE